MTSTTVDNLQSVIDSWKLQCKPEELVFAKTLYHDLQIIEGFLSETIENNAKLRTWQRDKLSEVVSVLNSTAPQTLFLLSHYNGECQNIISEYTKSTNTG